MQSYQNTTPNQPVTRSPLERVPGCFIGDSPMSINPIQESIDAAVSSPKLAADLSAPDTCPATCGPSEWAAYLLYCGMAERGPSHAADVVCGPTELEEYTMVAEVAWKARGENLDTRLWVADVTETIDGHEECGPCQGGDWYFTDAHGDELTIRCKLRACFAPGVTGGRMLGFYKCERIG